MSAGSAGIAGPVMARYYKDAAGWPWAEIIDQNHKVVASAITMDVAEYVAHCINGYERIVEEQQELHEAEITADEAYDQLHRLIEFWIQEQPK